MDILEGRNKEGNFFEAQDELVARNDRWRNWLTRHGYEAGRHYWPCKEGFRFSSGGIATAFALGVSK